MWDGGRKPDLVCGSMVSHVNLNSTQVLDMTLGLDYDYMLVGRFYDAIHRLEMIVDNSFDE